MALELQQRPLAVEARRIAAETPVGGHNAMARNDDRHGIGADRPSDRSGRAPNRARDLEVAGELPEPDFHEPAQYPAPERGRQSQINRKIQLPGPAPEVALQGLNDGPEPGFQSWGAAEAHAQVGQNSPTAPEFDRADALVGSRHQQVAEWRIERLIRQLRHGGSLAV